MKSGEEPLGPKIFVEMDFWRFPNESVQTNESDTRLMIVKHPLMGLRVEMARWRKHLGVPRET